MIRQGKPRWSIRRRVILPCALAVLGACALGSVLSIARGGFADAGSANDFMCFYAVGRAVARVGAAGLYNWDMLRPEVQAIMGRQAVPFLPWLYPPPLLLLLEPLDWLPLQDAHLAWSLGTLGLFAGVAFAIGGRDAAVGALACTLSWAEFWYGQNGFLNAALLGGGLLLAPSRPLAAGVLAGLLTYKPQLAAMLPVMLLATRNWRALGSAAATAGVMVAASAWRYGAASWSAFLHSGGRSAHVLLDGQVIDWGILQSVFGLLRWLGVGYPGAVAAQALVAGGAVLGVAYLGARPFSHEVRSALTALGTALATPYVLVWDMMLLGVAAAFLARLAQREGTPAWQSDVLALAVLSTFAAPLVPVGVPCAALLSVLLAHHVRRERRLFSAAARAARAGATSRAAAPPTSPPAKPPPCAPAPPLPA